MALYKQMKDCGTENLQSELIAITTLTIKQDSALDRNILSSVLLNQPFLLWKAFQCKTPLKTLINNDETTGKAASKQLSYTAMFYALFLPV